MPPTNPQAGQSDRPQGGSLGPSAPERQIAQAIAARVNQHLTDVVKTHQVAGPQGSQQAFGGGALLGLLLQEMPTILRFAFDEAKKLGADLSPLGL